MHLLLFSLLALAETLGIPRPFPLDPVHYLLLPTPSLDAGNPTESQRTSFLPTLSSDVRSVRDHRKLRRSANGKFGKCWELV